MTDTAADAARIVLEMALRFEDGIPNVLVVDHDPKFTSALFKEFTRCIGSSLLISSTYHKNTNAKAELVNGVWVTRCGPSPMAQGRLGSPLTSRPPRSLAT